MLLSQIVMAGSKKWLLTTLSKCYAPRMERFPAKRFTQEGYWHDTNALITEELDSVETSERNFLFHCSLYTSGSISFLLFVFCFLCCRYLLIVLNFLSSQPYWPFLVIKNHFTSAYIYLERNLSVHSLRLWFCSTSHKRFGLAWSMAFLCWSRLGYDKHADIVKERELISNPQPLQRWTDSLVNCSEYRSAP